MESRSEDTAEPIIDSNEMPEYNQLQVSAADVNGHADKDHRSIMTESEGCLVHSITASPKMDAETKFLFLEHELVEARSNAEKQAESYESELKVAQDKREDALVKLLQIQESTSKQIKDSDTKISLLEDELQKAKLDLVNHAGDHEKLKSESVQLADELIISQSKISEIGEKLEVSEKLIQKLASQEDTLLRQISALEETLTASEAKTKELEDGLKLQIDLHQSTIKELAEKDKSTSEIKEKVETELDVSKKRILDLENDLKSALKKEDEYSEHLRGKDELLKESVEESKKLQNVVITGDSKLREAEESINSLRCELEELKCKVVTGVEKESLLKTEMHLFELKEDFIKAQGVITELEAELKSVEAKAEDHLQNLRLSEEATTTSRAKILELETCFKSSEDLIESLQTELHERKLSSTQVFENWKEEITKSAEREVELDAKLKASEARCLDFESSVKQLTEKLEMLETSLAAFHCDSKLADDKIRKLEHELANAHQINAEFEENARIAQECSSHNENIAMELREKVLALEEMLASSQDNVKSNEELVEKLKNELHELKLSAVTDVEMWREIAEKSTQINEELRMKLKISEDRYGDLETTVEYFKDTSSKLEESLHALQQETKLADDRGGELEFEIKTLRELKAELEERLKISEESFSQHKECSNESQKRIIELEENLKSNEQLVESLQVELHGLKLSGTKAEELWREAAAKSAETEDELQVMLKASDERCHDLEMSVVHLTETSSKLKESLITLQSEVNFTNGQVQELRSELEKSQKIKVELEEKVRMSAESLFHHENNAKQSLQRSIELESLVTKHQTESKDAVFKVTEMDATLSSAYERIHELESLLQSAVEKATMSDSEVKKLVDMTSELSESVKTFESKAFENIEKINELESELIKSKQREEEILDRAHIAEENYLRQENAAKEFADRIADLEAGLSSREIDMDIVRNKVHSLEIEVERATQRAEAFESKSSTSEAKLLELEGVLKQAIDRSAELESCLEIAKSQLKDATEKVTITESLLVAEKHSCRQVEAEAKCLAEKLVHLENATKQAESRSTELECLLEDARVQAKEAADMLASNQSLLLGEQEKFIEANAEASDRLLQLENAIKQAVDRSAELEGLLLLADTQGKDANDRVISTENILQTERENSRQAIAEFAQQMLQLESDMKQATDRVTELEKLLEAADISAKEAADKVDSTTFLLEAEQARHQQSEKELKNLSSKLLQLEDALGLATSRVYELEFLFEGTNAQLKESASQVESSEANLRDEQQRHMQYEVETRKRLLQLEDDVKQATNRSVELEGLLDISNTEAKNANARAVSCEAVLLAEKNNHREAEAKASQNILQLEDSLKQMACKSSELESLMETTKTELRTAFESAASFEQVLAAERKNNRKTQADDAERILQLEDSVIQANARLTEFQKFLEAEHVEKSNAQEKLVTTEGLLLVEEAKHKETIAETEILREELLKLKEQFLLVQTDASETSLKLLTAGSRIHELEHLDEKLKAAEILVCSLNEKLSVTENIAHKAEADMHAAVLSECNLKEEMASLHITVGGLQTSLADVEHEKQALVAQTNDTRNRICDLEALVDRLRLSETLVSALTEKLSVAEAGTTQVEADLHAAVLNESKLREELSSYQASTNTLELQLAQLENEKQALMSKIDHVAHSSTALNEELACQKEQLQLQMAVITQENSELRGKVASLEGNLDASLKELEVAREQLRVSSSSEGGLEMDLQSMREELEGLRKLKENFAEAEICGKKLDANTRMEVLPLKNELKTQHAADYSNICNVDLQRNLGHLVTMEDDQKCEIMEPNILDGHEIASSKSRELDIDFGVPSGETRRRKGKEKDDKEESTLELKVTGKLKKPYFPASGSPLLFSLCVMSVLSLCTGFWIARRIYL